MWNTKAQAATAIGTVAKKLGKNLESPSLDHLLSAVLKGLSGRTWNGKVNLKSKNFILKKHYDLLILSKIT